MIMDEKQMSTSTKEALKFLATRYAFCILCTGNLHTILSKSKCNITSIETSRVPAPSDTKLNIESLYSKSPGDQRDFRAVGPVCANVCCQC